MSTQLLADIQAQIAKLEAQAQKLREEAAVEQRKVAASVIEEVRAKITEYGLTARDLGLSATSGVKQRRKGASPVTVVQVKVDSGTVYHGPNGEIWTGGSRGRKPAWLTEGLAAGKTLADFAISSTPARAHQAP